MKLGEFIEGFCHNNVIRLVYKNNNGGHETVLDNWNDVSMDWEVNKAKGKFRHYVNNEVIGIASISFLSGQGIHHPDALNIIIEKLENQPFIAEAIEDKITHECANN